MYVIVGATGNTGRVVAEQLLAEGREVRAWVRSEARGADLAEAGASLAVVDVEDDASVRAGFEGARAAYLMLPPPDYSKDGFLATRARIAKRLVDGAVAAGLEHVVLLSSIGAQHPEGTGVIRSLHHTEELLRASAIPATFLRPAYFVENWGSVLPAAQGDGVLPQMLGDATAPVPMVATRDIGRAAARALLEGPSAAGVIELEGPTRPSPVDIAASVASILGRPVAPIDVPFDAQVATLQSFGMSQDVASLFNEMNRGIAAGHVTFDGSGTHERGETDATTVLRALLNA
ncbi:MAG: NAD(P)H-binding protein [Sandaracinaceae bacterium]|nr:NAD(P)H-binding protein [Sandaracinaceae bacterium]